MDCCIQIGDCRWDDNSANFTSHCGVHCRFSRCAWFSFQTPHDFSVNRRGHSHLVQEESYVHVGFCQYQVIGSSPSHGPHSMGVHLNLNLDTGYQVFAEMKYFQERFKPHGHFFFHPGTGVDSAPDSFDLRVSLRTDERSVQPHVDLLEESVCQIVDQRQLVRSYQIGSIIFLERELHFEETLIQVQEILLRIDLEVHGVDPRVERIDFDPSS